jgi:hypothetical protein
VPAVGDQIELAATKVGQAPRRGVVSNVHGNVLTVRWPSGEQSTCVPGPGTLSIVGRTRAAVVSPKVKGRASKTATTAAPALASKTAKRPGGTNASTRSSPKKVRAKTVAKRAVAKKTAAKTTPKLTAKKMAPKAPVRKTTKRSTTPKRTTQKKAARKRDR